MRNKNYQIRKESNDEAHISTEESKEKVTFSRYRKLVPYEGFFSKERASKSIQSSTEVECKSIAKMDSNTNKKSTVSSTEQAQSDINVDFTNVKRRGTIGSDPKKLNQQR